MKPLLTDCLFDDNRLVSFRANGHRYRRQSTYWVAFYNPLLIFPTEDTRAVFDDDATLWDDLVYRLTAEKSERECPLCNRRSYCLAHD